MDNVTFTLILTAFTILIGIIGYLIKDKINSLEKEQEKSNARIESLEKEIKEMKTNYLGRFENVKQHISDELRPIFEKINEMSVTIAKLEVIKEK